MRHFKRCIDGLVCLCRCRVDALARLTLKKSFDRHTVVTQLPAAPLRPLLSQPHCLTTLSICGPAKAPACTRRALFQVTPPPQPSPIGSKRRHVSYSQLQSELSTQKERVTQTVHHKLHTMLFLQACLTVSQSHSSSCWAANTASVPRKASTATASSCCSCAIVSSLRAMAPLTRSSTCCSRHTDKQPAGSAHWAGLHPLPHQYMAQSM